MKKQILTFAFLWIWSIALWFSTSANSVNSSCDLSDKEAKTACISLWKSAPILESLVPLFEKKDEKIKGNVLKLLDTFKTSTDAYTRNIGIYFWYLVTKPSSSEQWEDKQQKSDDSSTDTKEQEKDKSSSDESKSSSSSEITPTEASTSSSSVVMDGSNAELVSNAITIKYWSFWVRDITYKVQWMNNTSVTLEIDGIAIDSTVVESNEIAFTDLHETLPVWKHTIALKANLDAEIHNQEIKIDKFTITDEYWRQTVKNLDISKLVTKAYPTISASTSSDDLILEISAPSSMDDDIEILWFLVDWEAITASINDKNIDLWADTSLNSIISSKNVVLAAWDSTEFRIQAARSSTLRVKGIIIKVDWRTYVIDDKYTNVWKWTGFKITAHWDSLPSGHYRLVSSSDDTTIIPSN